MKRLNTSLPRVENEPTTFAFTIHHCIPAQLDSKIIYNALKISIGTLNADEITRVLKKHVIERRDENGELMFPRLRHRLVSSWGNYAWDGTQPFVLENHVFVAKGVYRGRHVSDINIQVMKLKRVIYI